MTLRKTLWLLGSTIALAAALSSCGVSEHYVRYDKGHPQKPQGCAIDVYSQDLELHKKTRLIGEFKIEDTGFSVNCDAETVVQKLKAQACAEGADAIHLHNVQHPSWSGSTCFQATARFLVYEQ